MSIVIDQQRFAELTEALIKGPLREAIGYRVEHRVPYFKGIVGYMVEAPMLWIRRSCFPIFFVAYDRRDPIQLVDIVKQIEISQSTEYFALLIVVPTREGTGNEVQELKLLIDNSVYKHDFVVLDRQHIQGIIGENTSRRLIEIILDQGVDILALSPYAPFGPVTENMFFGREEEIKEISQNVSQQSYAIIGGRRIGKTSILHQLTRLLNRDPRYQAIYVNCEGLFDAEEFIQTFVQDIGMDFNTTGVNGH